MFRTNNCGELRIINVGDKITLAGWVQRTRKMGGMTFVDIRDRYGITQLVFNQDVNLELFDLANSLGREYVIQVIGEVAERDHEPGEDDRDQHDPERRGVLPVGDEHDRDQDRHEDRATAGRARP